ncbi:hypothetical protein ABTL61_19315, partial [Acinetobacter baumannii]
EEQIGKYCAVRLGFRQVDGFEVYDPDEDKLDNARSAAAKSRARSREDYWDQRIVAARMRKPFASLEDFARETRLPKRALILLADADAFRSLG